MMTQLKNPQKKKAENQILPYSEEMPRFPGCEHLLVSRSEKRQCAEEKLLEFIYDNIKYPNIAKENRIEGTVIIRFTVNKDGNIKDIKILREPDKSLGKAAYDLITSMSQLEEKWIPGKQHGRTVSVMYTLPIRFKLK